MVSTDLLLLTLLLLILLSLGEFGSSTNVNTMRIDGNTTTTSVFDVRDRDHNLSFKRTKVTSTRQKFFDNNRRGNESISARKRDNTNMKATRNQQRRQLIRKQYGVVAETQTSSKRKVGIGSRNPSNWKLDWDSDWDAEFSAGLATLHVLPDGKHVSAYLGRGVLGRFLFLNVKEDTPLSITVTPCTSILRWSVNMVPVNETNFSKISLKQAVQLETFRTQRINTFRIFKTQIAAYMIEIRPLYSETFVQLLITTANILEPFTQQDLSQPFGIGNTNASKNANAALEVVKSATSFNYNFISTSQMFLNPRVIVRRLRGNRIQVKWDSSPVNPRFMEYCIVVNTRRDYSTLCEAQGTKYGVVPPNLLDLPYYVYESPSMTMTTTTTTPATFAAGVLGVTEDISTNSVNAHGDGFSHRPLEAEDEAEVEGIEPNRPRSILKDDDFIIGCISRRRNYVLTDLKEGRLYYFNVFIRDLRTNLSYPYVRTTLKYKTPPKLESNVLRDSKPMKVRLIEGNTTILKFNLKKHCNELTMYIMPCGGGFIAYEVYTSNHSLYRSAIVENLEIIKTAEVPPGKYFINVQSYVHTDTAGNHANGARMVEVYLSAKDKKFPLPKLPANTKVYEIEDEKTCDSVTIEWWPSPDDRDNEYCFFLKLEERRRLFKFKAPNQCDVERSLRSDPYVSHSTCLQKTPSNSTKTLQHKIIGLQNAKTYELQLIVRRHNKKALSYELFHVTTLDFCIEK